MDKVQHFEVPTKNVERAQKFYQDSFGWEINKFDMPEGAPPYYIVHTTETDKDHMTKETNVINGGMTADDPAAGTAAVVVITVKDINESIEKVKANGGDIAMEPVQVADMGMYARFRDSEGNLMGLWQDLKGANQ